MSASAFSVSGWKTRIAKEDLSGLDLLPEESFLQVLRVEQRRSERSGRRFVLGLMQCSRLRSATSPRKCLESILNTLSASIRATDISGWYKEGFVLGVIFTEVGSAGDQEVTRTLQSKISDVLTAALGPEQAGQIDLHLDIFPENWDQNGDAGPRGGTRLPADPAESRLPRKASKAVKRLVDIAGSASALLILAPVMAVIAALVKLTSPGPVLFKQQRVGHHGRSFSFWKFRSMQCNNNQALHEEFIKTLIAGEKAAPPQSNGERKVYKIANDPRVTPIGRFLRRTSLDELPQFFNVLVGDKSLVGPRPPIPYEVKYYDTWHRRRVLDAKPGITGLWQVTGRSRVGFDDMVRLDLRYATSWSLWLDLKILLQTPRAVLGGEGAR